MNTELLQQFAEEVNKDWVGGYTAVATEDLLTVTLNGETVATCNLNGDVAGADQDAVEQLNYMVTR
jgi:hypothetical protein